MILTFHETLIAVTIIASTYKNFFWWLLSFIVNLGLKKTMHMNIFQIYKIGRTHYLLCYKKHCSNKIF